tara:strand:- start:9186 stop:10232 length:1047 start_codon:yes stop_codon:yes gene_type:complete
MSIKNDVKTYYGETLKTNADLKTDACCTDEALAPYVKKALSVLSDEVHQKYYGCGLVIPQQLEGANVLDLGSGAGRDVFALSYLVGKTGKVVGVDMTPAQIEVARKNIPYHSEKFGFNNVSFLEGDIEGLDKLDLASNSFDVIVSNCVINLVEDKKKVLTDAYNLLKEGGELYFSDVYTDRRLASELQVDPIIRGECLGGALYWNDFNRFAKASGFSDPRIVSSRELIIGDDEIKSKIAPARFYSVTYRLFKIPELEDACEDFGQAAKYKGTLPSAAKGFLLDNHHLFESGKWESVCGNTYLMLQKSRFAEHFEFVGDFKNHYGIFKGCGMDVPYDGADQAAAGAACC